MNQFEKAEEQLLTALPDLQKSYGEHHNITQKTISFLIDLYTAWGKEAKVAEYKALLSLREKLHRLDFLALKAIMKKSSFYSDAPSSITRNSSTCGRMLTRGSLRLMMRWRDWRD